MKERVAADLKVGKGWLFILTLEESLIVHDLLTPGKVKIGFCSIICYVHIL